MRSHGISLKRKYILFHASSRYIRYIIPMLLKELKKMSIMTHWCIESIRTTLVFKKDLKKKDTNILIFRGVLASHPKTEILYILRSTKKWIIWSLRVHAFLLYWLTKTPQFKSPYKIRAIDGSKWRMISTL